MGKKIGVPLFIVELPEEKYVTLNKKTKIIHPIALTSNMAPLIEFYRKQDLIKSLSDTYLFEEEINEEPYSIEEDIFFGL